MVWNVLIVESVEKGSVEEGGQKSLKTNFQISR
jgi:hypothetical protein